MLLLGELEAVGLPLEPVLEDGGASEFEKLPELEILALALPLEMDGSKPVGAEMRAVKDLEVPATLLEARFEDDGGNEESEEPDSDSVVAKAEGAPEDNSAETLVLESIPAEDVPTSEEQDVTQGTLALVELSFRFVELLLASAFVELLDSTVVDIHPPVHTEELAAHDVLIDVSTKRQSSDAEKVMFQRN